MRIKIKAFVLIILLFSLQLLGNVNAQSVRDKQVAKYLFDLGLYLRWEDDYNIELIKIGVLNSSQSFLNELKRITKNGYDNVVLVEVIDFKSVNEIKETHMLFLPKSENEQFNTVKSKIKGYNTVLITEEYSPKKSIMINFIKKGSNYTFEMNPENMKEANVGYHQQISQLGGIIISTKALFDESEKTLEKNKKKLKANKLKLTNRKN